MWHQRSDIDHSDRPITRPATRYRRIPLSPRRERERLGPVSSELLSFRDPAHSGWPFLQDTLQLAALQPGRMSIAARCPDCPDCPDCPGRVPAGRYCNLFPRLPIPARLSPSPLTRHTPMPLWVTATRLPQSPPLWTLRCDPKATNTHHTQPEALLCSTP